MGFEWAGGTCEGINTSACDCIARLLVIATTRYRAGSRPIGSPSSKGVWVEGWVHRSLDSCILNYEIRNLVSIRR